MPFIVDPEPEQFANIPEDENKTILESEAPSVVETFGAAFRQENSFVSAASKGFGISPGYQPEEGYDPYEDDLTGYELFAESFIDSKSTAETGNIKMMIDQEMVDRQTLSAAGGTGFVAQMAAGVTDPIYLPLMATGIGEIRMGANAAKAFGQTAAIGAFSEIPAEAAKQATQETRTIEESLINIGGAAFLSGLLGAGMSKLSNAQFNDLAKKTDDMLRAPEDTPNLSVGAAQVVQNSLEDLELVNAGKIEQWGVSPIVRTQVSPVVETRQIASQMMETPLISKGNIEGKSTTPEGGSVETRIKLWQAPLAEAIEGLDGSYLKYRQGLGNTRRIINDYVMRNRQNKLTPQEFRIEVGKAMRRDDKHDIPEVAEASQTFRQKLFDPLKDAAIEEKLLPRDVKTSTAVSYLTRVYNTKKIIAKSDEFDTITRDWLKGIRASAVRKRDGVIAKGKEPSVSLKGDAGLSDRELDAIVVSVRENITGVASGRLPYDVKLTERGPLKERVFTIQDELIEDFLESDIDLVARQYQRTMGPDVELNRMFGEVDGKETFEAMDLSYERLRKAATTEKERTRLNLKQEHDKRDLQAMWDRLRGTYRTPDDPNSFIIRANRTLRDVNFLRMLGGMTLSAIPDLARPIAVNGLRPVGRALKALAFAPKEFKMARLEAKKAAVGLDMVLNGRAASMAEISDIYARGTSFERGLRSTADAFGKITLMSQWNSSLKQFSGVVTQDRLLEQAVKFADGTISKNNLRRMAAAGINKEMADRIAGQFKKHGDEGTIKLSNGHKWDDREALETFRASVLKDVDRTILTPGEGEKPLWTSSETGKLIFQFKTFASVAHHKILLADLQHRDLQALNGFLISVGLGGMTYGLKQFVADRPISDDPAKIIVESLDRSGGFGYFWDLNNLAEKATRGHVGVNPLVGAPPMSRYASRNIVGAAAGPSFGTAKDILDVVGGAASGEFTQKEFRKLRKLMPGQNLFYMRRLLNELEKEAGRGLPE